MPGDICPEGLQVAPGPSGRDEARDRTRSRKPSPELGEEPYFSFRQLIDPRFSTLLDSISMSKPRSSRYLSVSTWPVPSSETPKPTYRRGEICFPTRSEEHTSELQSLMRIAYAVFC